MSLEVDGGHETYHSRHGALQESAYVFIQHGLDACPNAQTVLEVGFGTGLNALLAWKWAQEHQTPLHFISLELYPLKPEEWALLRFDVAIPDSEQPFSELHEAKWDEPVALSAYFTLEKRFQSWQEFPETACADVVFYDAFGPPVQPEMWTAHALYRAARILKPNGCFTTYCAKGSVRRRLQRAGLEVSRLPGPPGKRQMLQARAPTTAVTAPEHLNVRAYMVLLNTERSAVLMSAEWAAGVGMLKFPGGGMEEGEGPEDCVTREALEELGQAVEVQSPFWITPHFQRSAFNEQEQLLSLYFEVDLVAEQQFATVSQLVLPKGPGPEQFAWVTWQELRSNPPTFPIDKQVAEQLLKRFA